MHFRMAIQRITSWRDAQMLSNFALAQLAGLPESIVRDIDTDHWNPTLRTLERLERVVPNAWRKRDDRQVRPRRTKPQVEATNERA